MEVSQAVAEADPCPNSTTSAVPPVPEIVMFAANTDPKSGIGAIASTINNHFFLFDFVDLLELRESPNGVLKIALPYVKTLLMDYEVYLN